MRVLLITLLTTFYHCDAMPHNYLPSLPFPLSLSCPMADYGIPTLGLCSHPGHKGVAFLVKSPFFANTKRL